MPSVVTRYGLGDREVRVRLQAGERGFHFSVTSRPALRPMRLPTEEAPGSLSLSEVSWPERQAYHSYPTTAEIKKAWSYISTPHTSLCHDD